MLSSAIPGAVDSQEHTNFFSESYISMTERFTGRSILTDRSVVSIVKVCTKVRTVTGPSQTSCCAVCDGNSTVSFEELSRLMLTNDIVGLMV